MNMQVARTRKMLSYDDARDYVTFLFIMLKKETVILFRIEFLVVLVTILFFAMFLMDFFRRIIHNSFMRAVFSAFDAASDSIVLYLLGAMQSAPFKNQLFPVWALVLVNFRYSADYVSGYGVPDRRGRRFTEWRNVFKLLGSAFLNWSRGSSFTGPLWSVWCLQIVRSAYRLISHNLAFRSVWHGRSSQLVAEHMRATYDDDNDDDDDTSSLQVGSEPKSSHSQEKEPNSSPMKDYNYLVYGETKQGFKLKKPQYALSADTTARRRRPKRGGSTSSPRSEQESSPLVTLDKVWEYCPIDQPQNREKDLKKEGHKDLPLAFALSRLLRCRLEDVTLQGYRSIFTINRELVKSIIGGEVGASDALRIMELQLAFVHDYFNTRYPMVFWSGLRSLYITLCLSILTIGAVCWLAVDIRKVYKPPSGELANLVKGFNIDMIITWAFIVLMIAKELWEMATYLLSDWTSLIMVCEYVQRKCKGAKESVGARVNHIYSAKITDKRWHGFLDQYVFLQSYDDRPRLWNFVHNLTTGIIPKKDDGAKLSSAIKVPVVVKKAVLDKLSTMVEEKPGYEAYTAPPMSTQTAMPTSTSIVPCSHIAAATSILPTSSHIILVWHIATSLCEMRLAINHGVNLSNPGFPCSLLSWLTSCCSSKTYLMDLGEKKGGILSWFTNCCSSKSNEKLSDELRKSYTIANSLSRYCAYLLVSKPDLIPDSFLVPNIVFQITVENARDDILKNCDSLESRYLKLMSEAEKPIQDSEKEDASKQGAALGKVLLDLEPDKVEVHWKILAEVWTELLIHIAPTRNAQAHRKCLSGGEFISHIWALLWHYDIQKSSLWPNEVELGNNAPAEPGARNENNMDNTEQACALRSNIIQISTNVHDDSDEIKGTQEHETGNSRRGLGRTEGTESSEIEDWYLQIPAMDHQTKFAVQRIVISLHSDGLRFLELEAHNIPDLAKEVEIRISECREKKRKERCRMESMVSSLKKENQDIRSMSEVAISEKDAAENSLCVLKGDADQRRSSILQIAEKGLQKVGFGSIMEVISGESEDDLSSSSASAASNGRESKQEVDSLASIVGKTLKNMHYEINDLRQALDESS
ncbi:uncharacterized protein LOC119283964 [Triticum dicoccoides]|uniref:uncharacterized protein LOC119283964 n=1 Tax=Triticum dicoccoides TaxID=85692 RepID=UPI00188EA2D3|nr:uncharacterized protein LOC119283964 [Triticum dicoccoides]